MFKQILGRFRPSPALLVSIAALAVALGGVAWATIPGPNGVITTCYKQKAINSGNTTPLQLIDTAKTSCPSGFTTLSFNQTGPHGPAGHTGPRGPSDAYQSARAQQQEVHVYPLGTKVAGVDLPAGSYVINAKVDLANVSEQPRRGACDLSGPQKIVDKAGARLAPQGAAGDEATLSLQIDEPAQGKVGVYCYIEHGSRHGAIVASHAVLNATQVGTIHDQP